MKKITLSRQLNINFPIPEADCIVHSQPLTYAQYLSMATILAALAARLANHGVHVQQQCNVAVLTYREMIKERYADDEESQRLAQAEIEQFEREHIRLASIIQNGEIMPLNQAIEEGLIDDEALDYILSQLIFFTLAYRIHTKLAIQQWALVMVAGNGMQVNSLTATQLSGSLTTSSANAKDT
jgi:hypothetical protein